MIMKRILAIRTKDKEYAEELAKKFNRIEDSIFQTIVFTDHEAYEEFIKDNKVDVLLCDEEILRTAGSGMEADLVCGLSEVCMVSESAGTDMIFKYQASEKIMEEILTRYRGTIRVDIPKAETYTGNARLISVCSPVGGSYSSTFALALAQYYSAGARTLFVSFDPFFVLPGQTKDPTRKDLSDVIFYLNGMQPELMDFISKMTIKLGELDCVSGVSHWIDLYDMKPENMHDLIEQLCSDSGYKSIVFDLGIIGAAGMEVLMASKKIYAPARKGFGNTAKMKEWKRQIKFCGETGLLEKIKEITIPEDELLKDEYSYDSMLSGRLGRFIEESEGMQYYR